MTMTPHMLSTRTTHTLLLGLRGPSHWVCRGGCVGCAGVGGCSCCCCGVGVVVGVVGMRRERRLLAFHPCLFEHFATFATESEFSVSFTIVLADEVMWFFAVDEFVRTEWTNVNLILNHQKSSQLNTK